MTAILLMGLRGSGKSTAGAALAESLGRSFLDLDLATLAHLNTPTVQAAWDTLGEPAFRKAELAALKIAMGSDPNALIALGGGTPMIEGFDAVSAGSLRVYLHAPPAILQDRLPANDPNRPAITDQSPLEEIKSLYAHRHPVYTELARNSVDASTSLASTLEQLKDVCRSLD